MRKRADSAYFLGLVVWLAVAIIAGILLYATLVPSRQFSPDSSLSASGLAMEGSDDDVPLSGVSGILAAGFKPSSQIP